MIVDITMTPNMFIVILLVALAPLTGLYGWYFPKYHHQHLFRLIRVEESLDLRAGEQAPSCREQKPWLALKSLDQWAGQ